MFAITLDRGHYGKYNPGIVSGYYESEVMWLLGEYLTKYLEADGVAVRPTRVDASKDLPVYTRGQNANGSDFFISLHSDGCSTESVNRVTGIYQVNNDRSKDMATAVSKVVASVMGIDTAKQKDRPYSDKYPNYDYYGVLRGAASVSVDGIIIEHSFHTNKASCLWLMDETNIDRLARAEANTIIERLHKLYPERFIKGDINDDGKVTTADYALARRFVQNYAKPTLAQLYRGDTDNDGSLTNQDCVNIKTLARKGV